MESDGVKSIKSKLIVWFTIFMSLILITTSFLNYHVSKNKLKKELEAEEMINAQSIAYDIDRNIRSAQSIADTIAKMSEKLIYDEENYKNTKNYLEDTLGNILKTNEDLETIYTFFKPEMQIDKELPYICMLRDENKNPASFTTENIDDFPYWEMNWYQLGQGSETFEWTEPYLEEATKRTLISGVKKMKNTKGEYIGVAGIDFHLDKIENIMENIELKEGGFSFLISNDGAYIYHPDKEYILSKNINNKEDGLSVLSSEIQKDVQGYKQIKYNDKEYYVFYCPIYSSKWTVGIAYPLDILTKELNQILLINMTVLIAGIFLIIILSIGLSRKFLKSIDLGIKASKALAQGDLTSNIKVDSEDEIGTLVNEINVSLEGLKNIVSSINEDVVNVEDISVELTTVNENLISKSNRIIEQVEEVQQDINIGGTNIHNVYEIIEEVANFMDEINMTSQDNVDKTIQSVQVVESTKDIIETSINQLDKVIKLVNFAVSAIQRLEERTKQIESTLSFIRNISKQTNLLALNASIEAARAGDAGKGFAVVAEEIRKLAEESSMTVDEIEKLIRDINMESDETLASMHTDVEETVKQLESIKETQSNLDNILLNLQKFVDVSKSLYEMIKEQTQSTASAKDSVMEITSATEKIEYAIEDIRKCTIEQEEVINKVAKDSDDLHTISQNLQKSITRFKIK